MLPKSKTSMRQALYIIFLLLLWPATGSKSYPPLGAMPVNEEVILTDDSYTVEELVQDIFVNGACETITDINQIGDSRGIGYFEQGSASIGMPRGVILSTGPISNASGPNTATDRSGNFNDNTGDPDLNLLSAGQVRDAVGISFDFTPLDSMVTFRYVFASEEYCEYVGSVFNDVFGFFISGPGINGGFTGNAKNVALIPGSDDFVSINSVNHAENTDYYVHNELPGDVAECFLGIDEGGHLPEIEYDGFTKRLTARLQLTPCETYHIRLVVSDIADNFFDSAVFLEAESFNIGGEVKLTAEGNASPEEAAEEGCAPARFRFERALGSKDDFPLTVQYISVPQSSATAAEDYAPLSGSVTIPAGSDHISLPVPFFNDGIPEPTEQLTLALDIPCACYQDSATVYVKDSPGFELELPDIAICENSSNSLTPTITGGQAPFSYTWSNGSSAPTLSASADGPSRYSLTVTDDCGNVEVDSAQATVTTAPTAELSGAASICEGDSAFFPLQLTGTAPWTIAYSLNGNPQPPLTGVADANTLLAATEAGTYTLTAVEDAACQGTVSGSAELETTTITINATQQDASCPDVADGGIEASLSGGNPPYNAVWLDDPTAGLVREALPPATYTLMVSDNSGCQTERVFEINHPEPISPVRLDCERLQTGQLSLSAGGGTPPYQYSVDGDNFYGPSLFEELTPGTTYPLTVQDANGCQLQQELLMPTAYERVVDLPASLQLKLGSDYPLDLQLNIPPDLIASIQWSPKQDLSCTDCLNPVIQATQSQTYTLTVTDIFGCTSTLSLEVEVDNSVEVYFPNIFSPNGDKVNDYFTVFANERQVERVVQLRVFNRWGGLMYEAGDFAPNLERAGWDGTFLGEPMDPGVYTYFVLLQLRSGSTKQYGGDLLLVR
jgi:gliding motility-associated-like protein